MDDLNTKIRELENKLDSSIKLNKDLENKLNELSEILRKHEHSGSDGSSQIFTNPIILNDNVRFQTGLTSIDSKTSKLGGGNEYSVTSITTGEDSNSNGIVDKLKSTTQLTIQHSHIDDTSFVYIFRNPYYDGKCNITSGLSEIIQNKFIFELDELKDSFITIKITSSTFNTYKILSNTNNTITVSGTLPTTISDTNFAIFKPVYLGSGTFPFRRIYTLGDTDGGIRFGNGTTGNGQNGLLFLNESTGRLQFRRPNGTIDTV